MRNTVSFYFSNDLGKALENLVFIELVRKRKNVFVHKSNGECDFIVEEKGVITEAIQVCYELTEANKKREFRGATSAMKCYGLEKSTVVTYNQSGVEMNGDGKEIAIQPAWKWLLG